MSADVLTEKSVIHFVQRVLIKIANLSINPNSDTEVNAMGTPDAGDKGPGPADISEIPEDLIAEADDRVKQSEVLREIIATTLEDPANIDAFNDKRVHTLKLSELERHFKNNSKKEKKANVLKLLSMRNQIKIDEHFRLRVGTGQINMTTDKTMLDYHLTVGKGIGLSSMLPNTANSPRFSLDMDLQRPYREMLYIGTAMNEDIFVAMAPNTVLSCEEEACAPGYNTGSSVLSRRHYRQVVMMFAHFLAAIPEKAYMTVGEDVYQQNLESAEANWHEVTNILDEDAIIKLNFEMVKRLDHLIVEGYDEWVREAPAHWKTDGFMENHSPIVGEAANWDMERDYSKIGYVTFALATSIECTQVEEWEVFPPAALEEKYGKRIYDQQDPHTRKRVKIEEYELCDEDGVEIQETDHKSIRPTMWCADGSGERAHTVQPKRGVCGGEEGEMEEYTDFKAESVKVDVYPLGFLRVAGNVQATTIPPCFYQAIGEISRAVRKDANGPTDGDENLWASDLDSASIPRAPVIKPISSQFYNYISHRAATRAGRFDTQQGTVTAALAGAFAQTAKDKATAMMKQEYCQRSLPSDRFQKKISHSDCPVCCRAEIVYAVNVRALKSQTGRSIFSDIILPLARAWKRPDVRGTIKNHLVILKPEAFPSLYDWVSYPITLLIKEIYKQEIEKVKQDAMPCHMRLELLAALERALCFCHTGNAASLATSLMGPLGLSRGLIKDGFPMLLPLFEQPTIVDAIETWVQNRPSEMATQGWHFYAYQAKFVYTTTLSINPTFSYKGIASSHENRAMRISEITFMALCDDVKRLVADGTWLSKDRPLSYGQIDLNHTFTSLVKAVIADPDLISYGLPNFVEHAMTPTTFADSLIKMSSPLDPSPPAAPVLSNGSFLPLLKEAHRILLSLARRHTQLNSMPFIRLFFLRAIQLLRIRFVPSHRPRSAADSALTNALATDANADWSIKEISIPKIHSILHKSSLPDDFATPSLTNVPYVDDTYAWNIPKRLFHNANTPSQVHAVWNTLSWVKRDNKKACLIG
ncbi:hypothetical protein BJY52DRAFT_1229143 [Lactarius psammicola]|nr:hypothetical protein BJY52DRAFT_1229143 [Lactarius psammicola]